MYVALSSVPSIFAVSDLQYLLYRQYSKWRSSTFLTQRVRSMHDLKQRTLQACRWHVLSLAVCSQQLLLILYVTPCLRWSSTFLTQRVKCTHDLTQRTLQACRWHVLSHAQSLPRSQRQCHHATCESSRCHVLVLTLPLRASNYTFCRTLPAMKLYILNATWEVHARPYAANSASM